MDSELDEEAVKQTLVELTERLKQAEELWAGADFAAVVSITGTVLEVSQSLPVNYGPVIVLRAAALVLRGNALREQGTGVTRKAALACHDEALRLWDRLPAEEIPHFRNHQAKAWMNRGITLLNEGSADYLTEAVRCFDQSIQLRQQLIKDDPEPLIRYGLAAGWMNRADALTKLEGESNLNEALRSYDEALGVMDTLAIDTNPLFRQRIAIAWLNRGLTWEMTGTNGGLAQALESFDKSIAVLENAPQVPQQQQVLAAAWMNRGNVLLRHQPADPVAARENAQRAMQAVAESERNNIADAEIGLKARHVACRAIARLTEQMKDRGARDDVFAEATDLVDDGMEIVRHWHARGVRGFGPIANDLFRFGAKLYQVYQPHFVDEFVEENQGLGLSLQS
ncbi:MAG: hypothetical protein K0Q55_2260 [Verrucomicrobia bacterium]|jgi:tetratricopeptide (TPR) repeat protein|nr:hypothetical protein [Verrucomicrobiota bacterium]